MPLVSVTVVMNAYFSHLHSTLSTLTVHKRKENKISDNYVISVVFNAESYCCFSHGLFVAVVNNRMVVVSFCAT